MSGFTGKVGSFPFASCPSLDMKALEQFRHAAYGVSRQQINGFITKEAVGERSLGVNVIWSC